jgi:hypothetical protein
MSDKAPALRFNRRHGGAAAGIFEGSERLRMANCRMKEFPEIALPMNRPGIFLLALLLQCPARVCSASEAPESARAQQVPQTQTRKKPNAPAPRRRVPAISPETLAAPTTTTQATIPRQPEMHAIPRASQSPPADRPTPVTGCDPGGCWDTGGNRYNSGAGNTYLNNAGKLCTRNGAWMQCF